MDVVQPAVVMTSDPAAIGNTDAERPPTFKQRVEYFGLRTAVALARLLPISWVTGIAATIAGLGGPFLRQHRRALANLEIAFPEKSPAERAAIARAMWANMGRTIGESLIFDRIARDPETITIVDREMWQARISEPVAAICCTLHMGSWELAASPLTQFGRNPVGVFRPLGNPKIDHWLVETRGVIFPGGLLGKGDDDGVRGGQRTARRLIDLARRGGAIGFVCDHFDRRGEPIPFMGRTAKFTTAPAMIARHVGAKFWLGRCLRIGTSSRFRIDLVELAVPRTNDKSADAVALTTEMFAQFERWIRETPEQWMWWNTRWTSGAPSPSSSDDA